MSCHFAEHRQAIHFQVTPLRERINKRLKSNASPLKMGATARRRQEHRLIHPLPDGGGVDVD